MMDDEQLAALLRTAVPSVAHARPVRDLWADVATRSRAPEWTWIDLGVAAALAAAVIVYPQWLWLLAYCL